MENLSDENITQEENQVQEDNINRVDNTDLLTKQDQIDTSDTNISTQSNSTMDEELHDVINKRTSYVDNMLLDINKVSHTAFNPDKNPALYQENPRKIAMERRGSKKEINTLVSINFDAEKMREEGLSIRGTEKLNQFDRSVLDAINTLYIEGKNEYITTAMVFHVLTGDPDKRMSSNYALEINNSITKLLFTHITIKANEEAIMYPELKDFEYHDTIVPGRMVKAKLNGTEVACVQVRAEPPLYLYAKKKNQISRIDLTLIKTPFASERKESSEQMSLLFYLIRRIVALKSISSRIRYDTLYHDFGYDNTTKQNKLKFRKRIKNILDDWKGHKFGDIEFVDYTEEKKGQVPYEITLEYRIINSIS